MCSFSTTCQLFLPVIYDICLSRRWTYFAHAKHLMNIGNHYTRLYSLQICSCFSCAVGVELSLDGHVNACLFLWWSPEIQRLQEYLIHKCLKSKLCFLVLLTHVFQGLAANLSRPQYLWHLMIIYIYTNIVTHFFKTSMHQQP